MKALLLVAHPDDELIFAGGLMLWTSHTDWEWEVVCMTHRTPTTRGQRFRKSMHALSMRGVNVRGTQLELPDEGAVLHDAEFTTWRDAVQALDRSPDIVFTHNRLGEYGHPHHMACHTIASELFENVWSFYCEFSKVIPQERLARIEEVPLLDGLMVAKRHAMQEAYKREYSLLAVAMPDLIGTMFGYGPEVFTTEHGVAW